MTDLNKYWMNAKTSDLNRKEIIEKLKKILKDEGVKVTPKEFSKLVTNYNFKQKENRYFNLRDKVMTTLEENKFLYKDGANKTTTNELLSLYTKGKSIITRTQLKTVEKDINRLLNNTEKGFYILSKKLIKTVDVFDKDRAKLLRRSIKENLKSGDKAYAFKEILSADRLFYWDNRDAFLYYSETGDKSKIDELWNVKMKDLKKWKEDTEFDDVVRALMNE